MKVRQVEVHRHPGSTERSRGSLLFIHGAYVHSGYWALNFIPFFQQHGYDCFALDLAGHGASQGREDLDQFGIDDYAEDLAHTLDLIGNPAIVIGHSMGALVLQRYLEKGTAHAAIFLSPVPPTGTTGSAAQLALRYPGFFQSLEDTVRGWHSEEDRELMAKVYFTDDVAGKDILDFLPMIGPESARAVAEMALLPGRPPVRRQRLPTLVVGGEEDMVFSPSLLVFTALPWQADIVRVPGAGHMLPLDRNWHFAAARMLEWIGSNVAAEVVL